MKACVQYANTSSMLGSMQACLKLDTTSNILNPASNQPARQACIKHAASLPGKLDVACIIANGVNKRETSLMFFTGLCH